MFNAKTGFAQYSRVLCFAMSFIWLLLAILSFTSDAPNGTIIGLLWMVGTISFAVSGIFLKKNAAADES